MLNRHARGFFTALFTPIARWLLRAGVSPDAVTIIGTAGVVVGALVFYPLGQLWWGTLFITAFIFSFLGSGIVSLLNPAFLRPIVLILLVLVAIYVFFVKDLGIIHQPKHPPKKALPSMIQTILLDHQANDFCVL